MNDRTWQGDTLHLGQSRHNRWRSAAVLLTIVCGALALASCRTIDGTYGVPPFYEVYPTPSSSKETSGSETFVRPFVSVESHANESWRVRSIPPLLDLRRSATDARYLFFPFFYYRNLQRELGGRDLDWFLFPLFFGGSDSENGSYFAVFPLGGTLKGLLAQDDIAFALFPLLWLSRTDERRSLHLFWPFFNYVWGGDWEGWRIWPFYGRYRAYTPQGRKRYDRGFVAWPFYIRRQDRLHDEPTDLFFSFPFYGQRLSRNMEMRTYLWPLFLTRHDKMKDRKTYLGYLFPYRFTEGQADLWPFFGSKRTTRSASAGDSIRRRYRQFAMWPLQRYDWTSDGEEETTNLWLLPFLWHSHSISKDSFKTRSAWNIWPFVKYRRDGAVVAVDAISPFWFEREEYERYYSRWFHLFRYRSGGEISGWELLYGAIMYRRQKVETSVTARESLTGAGQPRETDSAYGSTQLQEERIFSILGGLFACGKRGNDVILRLFWLPWW